MFILSDITISCKIPVQVLISHGSTHAGKYYMGNEHEHECLNVGFWRKIYML